MNKYIKIVITLLLISNLILIGFLYLGKPNNGPQMKPMKVIIEQLNFDENQKEELAQLVEVHREEMMAIHQKITSAKNDLYKELKGENPSLNDSLLLNVTNEVKQIETAHFNHFIDIKNICNEEQKVQFNKMANELSAIFQPKKRPNHKRNDK